MLPILESRILELYENRITNEVKKKESDTTYGNSQRDFQKRLSDALYLELKRYGWVLFVANEKKNTRVQWRIDRNGDHTVVFRGGGPTCCLPVEQAIVDLQKKKKLRKIEMRMVTTEYRFKGMFVLRMIFFCYLFLFKL